MRYVNRVLGWFRHSAKTIGLSPKILAPAIGAGITALIAVAGLSPHDIGQVIGVSDEVATAGVLVVAAKVAAYLLPPGDVLVPPRVAPASDELLAPAVREKLGA